MLVHASRTINLSSFLSISALLLHLYYYSYHCPYVYYCISRSTATCGTWNKQVSKIDNQKARAWNWTWFALMLSVGEITQDHAHLKPCWKSRTASHEMYLTWKRRWPMWAQHAQLQVWSWPSVSHHAGEMKVIWAKAQAHSKLHQWPRIQALISCTRTTLKGRSLTRLFNNHDKSSR